MCVVQSLGTMYIFREHDNFELELTDLKKQHAYIDAAHGAAVRERDELTTEVGMAVLHPCKENQFPMINFVTLLLVWTRGIIFTHQFSDLNLKC